MAKASYELLIIGGGVTGGSVVVCSEPVFIFETDRPWSKNILCLPMLIQVDNTIVRRCIAGI